MKYLLDTHVAIWALEEKEKLSPKAKTIVENTKLTLCVSIVSAWEIAIKLSVGKLDFSGGSAFFLKEMQRNGITVINVDGTHIEYVEKLPLLHRDPFDRLLVATAATEGMTLITIDENIHKYDVPILW
jgi:PIN domain nuclease of toxin-antitoxin system